MVFEAFLGLIEAGILRRAVDGVILHGAFFLGPKAFYRALREMKGEEISRICMMPVHSPMRSMAMKTQSAGRGSTLGSSTTR